MKLNTLTSENRVLSGQLLRKVLVLLVIVVVSVAIWRELKPSIVLSERPQYASESSKASEGFRAMQKIYEMQVDSRKKELNAYSGGGRFGMLYSLIVPEAYCGSMVRIGAIGDGGKWLCSPHKISQDECNIMSLGVANDISFEEQLQTVTGQRCNLYSFDKGDQSASLIENLKKVKGTFLRAQIGTKLDPANHLYTLDSIMKKYNMKSIEILKIDIEGAEMDVLIPLLKTTKMCQILIEIHGSVQQVIALLKSIGQNGYHIFSRENMRTRLEQNYVSLSAIKTVVIIACIIVVPIVLFKNLQARRTDVPDELRNGKLGGQKMGTSDEYQEMKRIYSEQAQSRRDALDHYTGGENFGLLYSTIVPETHCGSLVRLGAIGDGGKWVCYPSKIAEGPCTILSFGMHNEVSFEEHLQTITKARCNLYAFDEGQQSASTIERLKKVNGQAMKARIGMEHDPSANKYSIDAIMEKFNIKSVEAVKMDIEGAELEVLIPFLSKVQVCQLFIEIHGTTQQTIDLLKKTGALGYHIFSREVNAFTPVLSEYSFVHQSCMHKYGITPLARYLV